MQTAGYIQIDGKKILILVRQSRKEYRCLKMRKSGKDGSHFTDEECFLSEYRDILDRLIKGAVVKI